MASAQPLAAAAGWTIMFALRKLSRTRAAYPAQVTEPSQTDAGLLARRREPLTATEDIIPVAFGQVRWPERPQASSMAVFEKLRRCSGPWRIRLAWKHPIDSRSWLPRCVHCAAAALPLFCVLPRLARMRPTWRRIPRSRKAKPAGPLSGPSATARRGPQLARGTMPSLMRGSGHSDWTARRPRATANGLRVGQGGTQTGGSCLQRQARYT